MILEPGDRAPEFTLLDDQGATVKLSGQVDDVITALNGI